MRAVRVVAKRCRMRACVSRIGFVEQFGREITPDGEFGRGNAAKPEKFHGQDGGGLLERDLVRLSGSLFGVIQTDRTEGLAAGGGDGNEPGAGAEGAGVQRRSARP